MIVSMKAVVQVTLTALGAVMFNQFFVYPTAKEGDIKEMFLWHLTEVFGDGPHGVFVNDEIKVLGV